MKKTVKNYCLDATDRKIDELYEIAERYGDVKNEVFRLYGSLEGLKYLRYPREARDKWVKEKYADRFGLQARFWKMAFEEAFANIKTNWEQAFIKVRQLLYRNPNFSEDEKHYCYYLLKATDLLYQALKLIPISLPDSFKEKALDTIRCHKYLKRQIRKHIGKRSVQRNRRSFALDNCMYNYYLAPVSFACSEENKKGRLWLGIMGINRGKRIRLRLTADKQFTGNIRVVLHGKRIEVHGTEEIEIKKPNKDGKVISIDKGFNELITTSENKRYGKDFGLFIRTESDRLSQKNARRNKLRALAKKYREKNNHKKASCIERHNLGRKKYNKQRIKNRNKISDFINLSLNQFLKESIVSILIVEALKFSRFNKKLVKKVKRYLSSWLKGYLQKRLEYKCQENSVLLGEVNPAYTSQECSICKSLNTIRRGNMLHCNNCSRDVDANYNATLTILSRYKDPDIGLYTPYKKVKYILEERFSRSVETGQPGVETPLDFPPDEDWDESQKVNPTANYRIFRFV